MGAETDQRTERAERMINDYRAALTRSESAASEVREHLVKLVELDQFSKNATVAEVVPLLRRLVAILDGSEQTEIPETTYTPDPSAVSELREHITELLDGPNEAVEDALLGFAYNEVARVAGDEMVARWQAEDLLKDYRKTSQGFADRLSVVEAERDALKAELDRLAKESDANWEVARAELAEARAAIERVAERAKAAKGGFGKICCCADCEDAQENGRDALHEPTWTAWDLEPAAVLRDLEPAALDASQRPEDTREETSHG